MRAKDLSRKAAEAARRTGARVRRHPALLACVLLLVAKQMAVVWYLIGQRNAQPNMLIAMTGQGLALFAWAFALRGWKRLAALAALDLAIGALLLTDLFYFRQFADLPSIGSLKHANLVGGMEGVGGIFGEIFHATDLLLFAGAPLILLAGGLGRTLREGEHLPRGRALKLTAVGVLMLLSVVATTARLRKPFGGHTEVASRLGPVGYHAYDIVTQVGRDVIRRLTPVEERIADARRYFAEERPKRAPARALAGIARGKNVIYVQLESWQAFAIGKKVAGKAITPNLDRLLAESLHFPSFHAQVQQGTTSDAELLAQCSLYPSRTGSVYYDHAGADFRCLPEVLRDHGYRTIAMHGNRPDFWNRGAMYPSIGIDRFYDIRDFDAPELIGLGVPDVTFFEQAVDKLAAERKPFYALLVSITSHNPFDYEGLPRGELDHGALSGTRIAAYLDSLHYTDRAIGVLLDRLEATGLLDESILVVYGDHQGVAQDNSNVGEWLGLPEDDPVRTFQLERHVPGLVRLPGGAHAGRYELAAGQIDLAPTIARLLDLPTDDAAFFGRDLLSGAPGFVVFPNGSAVTDDLLFLSSDGGHGRGGCFALPSGERVAGERCAPLEERLQRELTVSWNMLDSGLVAQVAKSLREKTAVSGISR